MTPKPLRSARWFDTDDLRGFGHRSRLMQMGYGVEDWNGRPVIAILNTWSDINPCHAHFRQRVEDVKRGVLQAGGFPLELPAISLPENFVKPRFERGYGWMFSRHIGQAHEGCDFDFLQTSFGAPVSEPDIL